MEHLDGAAVQKLGPRLRAMRPMTQLPGVAVEMVEELGPTVFAKLQHPWQA